MPGLTGKYRRKRIVLNRSNDSHNANAELKMRILYVFSWPQIIMSDIMSEIPFEEMTAGVLFTR